MRQLAIRISPVSPVSNDEVDAWLQAEVERVREGAPQAALRVLRLRQPLPTGDADVGWLIELDAAGGAAPLNEDELTRILRDLRLLGLQPTLLQAGSMAGSDFTRNGGGH
jgi:hypothetical protein